MSLSRSHASYEHAVLACEIGRRGRILARGVPLERGAPLFSLFPGWRLGQPWGWNINIDGCVHDSLSIPCWYAPVPDTYKVLREVVGADIEVM